MVEERDGKYYHKETGEMLVTEEDMSKNSDYTRDSDVLDTWFSSGLWPFSTLGWGNGEEELGKLFQENDMKDFYPNSLLITGFDIMFFWVARMMMMGEYFMKELPFEDIYMHALVRDEHGNKMSKSKGNVIDPLDMVEEHSADIIRFTLAFLAVQGRDIKLGSKNLEQFRNFTNKLYNASNFLQLNMQKILDMVKILLKRFLLKHETKRKVFIKFLLVLSIFASLNLAPIRFASEKFTSVRFAFSRFAPLRLALRR